MSQTTSHPEGVPTEARSTESVSTQSASAKLSANPAQGSQLKRNQSKQDQQNPPEHNQSQRSSSPWRLHDYRWWFVSDTSGQLGYMITYFAFTLLTYSVVHDVAIAGIVGSVYSLLAGVSTLLGGIVSDMCNRRMLIFVSGFLSLAILVALSALYALGMLNFPLLLIFAIARALFSGIFSNVTNIVLPQITSGELLTKAYASNQSRDAAINIISTPVAGWLFALAPEVPFLIAAVTGAVKSLAITRVRASLAVQRPSSSADATATNTASEDKANASTPSTSAASESKPEEASSNSSLRATLSNASLKHAFLWYQRHPSMLILTTYFALLNMVIAYVMTMILLDQQQLQTPSWLIGLFDTAFGLGSIIGGLFSSRITDRVRGSSLVQFAILYIAAMAILLSMTQNIFIICTIAFFNAIPLIPTNAILGSYFQLLTPDHLRGRIGAIQGCLGALFGAFGTGASGVLLKFLGYQPAVLVGAALVGLSGVFALFLRSMRDIPAMKFLKQLKPLE